MENWGTTAKKKAYGAFEFSKKAWESSAESRAKALELSKKALVGSAEAGKKAWVGSAGARTKAFELSKGAWSRTSAAAAGARGYLQKKMRERAIAAELTKLLHDEAALMSAHERMSRVAARIMVINGTIGVIEKAVRAGEMEEGRSLPATDERVMSNRLGVLVKVLRGAMGKDATDFVGLPKRVSDAIKGSPEATKALGKFNFTCDPENLDVQLGDLSQEKKQELKRAVDQFIISKNKGLSEADQAEALARMRSLVEKLPKAMQDVVLVALSSATECKRFTVDRESSLLPMQLLAGALLWPEWRSIRGLAAMHPPGSGKTCVGTSVINALVQLHASGLKHPIKTVWIFVPKNSVAKVWVNEIMCVCGSADSMRVISKSDSGANLGVGKVKIYVRSITHVEHTLRSNPKALENTIVIVDETHKMMSPAGTNIMGEANAAYLRDLINYTLNCRVLLLSATLLSKSSDVCILNMIKPRDAEGRIINPFPDDRPLPPFTLNPKAVSSTEAQVADRTKRFKAEFVDSEGNLKTQKILAAAEGLTTYVDIEHAAAGVFPRLRAGGSRMLFARDGSLRIDPDEEIAKMQAPAVASNEAGKIPFNDIVRVVGTPEELRQWSIKEKSPPKKRKSKKDTSPNDLTPTNSRASSPASTSPLPSTQPQPQPPKSLDTPWSQATARPTRSERSERTAEQRMITATSSYKGVCKGMTLKCTDKVGGNSKIDAVIELAFALSEDGLPLPVSKSLVTCTWKPGRNEGCAPLEKANRQAVFIAAPGLGAEKMAEAIRKDPKRRFGVVYFGEGGNSARSVLEAAKKQSDDGKKKVWVVHQPKEEGSAGAQEAVLKAFNSDPLGKVIHGVIYGPSAETGVSFAGVTHLHRPQPPTSLDQRNQSNGRIRRLASHCALPEDQRFTRIFQYILTDAAGGMESTKDGVVLRLTNKPSDAETMLRTLQDAAIDAPLFADVNKAKESAQLLADATGAGLEIVPFRCVSNGWNVRLHIPSHELWPKRETITPFSTPLFKSPKAPVSHSEKECRTVSAHAFFRMPSVWSDTLENTFQTLYAVQSRTRNRAASLIKDNVQLPLDEFDVQLAETRVINWMRGTSEPSPFCWKVVMAGTFVWALAGGETEASSGWLKVPYSATLQGMHSENWSDHFINGELAVGPQVSNAIGTEPTDLRDVAKRSAQLPPRELGGSNAIKLPAFWQGSGMRAKFEISVEQALRDMAGKIRDKQAPVAEDASPWEKVFQRWALGFIPESDVDAAPRAHLQHLLWLLVRVRGQFSPAVQKCQHTSVLKTLRLQTLKKERDDLLRLQAAMKEQ